MNGIPFLKESDGLLKSEIGHMPARQKFGGWACGNQCERRYNIEEAELGFCERQPIGGRKKRGKREEEEREKNRRRAREEHKKSKRRTAREKQKKSKRRAEKEQENSKRRAEKEL